MMLRSGSLSLAISPQFTAFFTSALILASSLAVNCFSAKAVGHIAPSSRFALSLKPNAAYLVLNFCALWKKQTTSPSLAYAGIPYQVLGERAGALALMMAWSRSAMVRSASGISAIFASTSLSPSALPARGPRRASAFSSLARSLIAARSSSVNPLDALPVVLLADFCVCFAWASLPGAFFSDISVSFLVAFRRRTHQLSSGGRAVSRDVTKNQNRGRRLLQCLVRRSLCPRTHHRPKSLHKTKRRMASDSKR